MYAYDLAAEQGQEPELDVRLNRVTGHNGDVLHLTVKALRAGKDGGSRFILFSKLGSDVTFSYGYVSN